MDCVIYIRWSSLEQGKGSSLERQREDCRAHAAANGWRVIDELVDDGISAFKGEHASSGALGAFARDVRQGRWPDGVVLLCEKLDRLSRQEPKRVFVWLLDLTDAGVIVATVDGAREYSTGNLDMASIIEVVVKAQLSHEESEKKSQRLGAAWAAKRRRLASGERFVATRRAPAWLEVVGSPARFEVIPDRAEIVRRIFEETVAGFGKQHIAKRLNLDCVPPFGRGDAWHASSVQKILRNPAVIGELHTGTKARGSRREMTGDIIVDYFPRIVDASLHQRAEVAMRQRARRFTGRGRRLVNIFSGLARCGVCHSRMTFRGKGRKQRADGSWVHEDYLVCDGYQRGKGCKNALHYNYQEWETAILDPIVGEALREDRTVIEADVRELEIEIAMLERSAAQVRKQAESALTLAVEVNRHETRALYARLAEEADIKDAEVAEAKMRLRDLEHSPSSDEIWDRVEKLFSSLNSEEEEVRFEARNTIMGAIHAMIDELTFHGPENRKVTFKVASERIVTVGFHDVHDQLAWEMKRIDGRALGTFEFEHDPRDEPFDFEDDASPSGSSN